MPTLLPRRAGGARPLSCLSWALSSVLISLLLVAPGPARASDPVDEDAGSVTITGRGWGHGRGMGQYGALGYAVDHGWDSARILDHFYGGTTSSSVGNPIIGVELVGLTGDPLIATGRKLALNGKALSQAAIMATRAGPGRFDIKTGPGCAGPWTSVGIAASGSVITSAVYSSSADSHVRVCEPGRTRGYRGQLQLIDAGGRQATVNQVRLEDYLKGVVPRESPASWASLGEGRGAQALQAQAVAARSYAISSPRSAWSTTCDTISCQVYGGEFIQTSSRTILEDSRTNAAIDATAGQVRKHSNGRVARTEFSSSTGGWSAGGAFPMVRDEGDDISTNPNRSWTATLSWADLERRMGLGPLEGVAVTKRTGRGAYGGRVLEVTATTDDGRTTTITGRTARTRMALKSDWFTIDATPPAEMSTAQASALTSALYRDFLGRAPSQFWLDKRVAQLRAGYTQAQLAAEISTTRERLESLTSAAFAHAMGRRASSAELTRWTDWLAANRSLPGLRVELSASPAAVQSGDGTAAWVNRVHQGALNREASSAATALWATRVRRSGHRSVAQDLAVSRQARQIRLDQYYSTFLGRRGGSARDLSALARDGDFSVPARLASSQEYFNQVT